MGWGEGRRDEEEGRGGWEGERVGGNGRREGERVERDGRVGWGGKEQNAGTQFSKKWNPVLSSPAKSWAKWNHEQIE